MLRSSLHLGWARFLLRYPSVSGFLSLYGALHRRDDGFCVKSIFLQELDRLPALTERVVYCYHLQGCRVEAAKNLRYRISKATVDLVLFARHRATCFLNGGQNSFYVERLDRMNIDQLHTDAHFGQRRFGLDSNPYHMTAGEYGDIAALDEGIGLANRKGLIRFSEYGPAGTSEAQICGTDMIAEGNGSCLRLVIIARHNYRHARKHLHHADVFQNLVRRTVFSKREACVGGAYLNVFVRIRY